MRCPCCGNETEAPTFEMVADFAGCREGTYKHSILKTVWKGKGVPVMPARIYDAMWADDPDGGPSENVMAQDFKINLCKLRKRLVGSGAAIENAGYGMGYRLVIGKKAAATEAKDEIGNIIQEAMSSWFKGLRTEKPEAQSNVVDLVIPKRSGGAGSKSKDPAPIYTLPLFESLHPAKRAAS